MMDDDEVLERARVRGLAPSRVRLREAWWDRNLEAYRYRIEYVVSEARVLDFNFLVSRELREDEIAARAFASLCVDEALHRFVKFVEALPTAERTAARGDIPPNFHGQKQGRPRATSIFAVAKLGGEGSR